MAYWIKAFFVLISLTLLAPVSGSAGLTDPVWSRTTSEATKIIQLHFFWSKTCPHCRKAKPFIKELARSYDWLELNSYEIGESQENAVLYRTFLEKIGEKNLQCPPFCFVSRL
jgi:thiol-disulfide isomerase/thioredoxin